MKRRYEILAAIICMTTAIGIMYYQYTIQKPVAIPPTIKVIYEYEFPSDDESYDEDAEDADAEDLK